MRQEWGWSTCIPADGIYLRMFIVSDQILPEVWLVLILLQETSDAYNYMLWFNIWGRNSIELTYCCTFKALLEIHLGDILITDKYVSHLPQVKLVSLYLGVCNLLLKDGNQESELMLLSKFHDVSYDWRHMVQEKLKQGSSNTCVFGLHKICKDNK